MLAPVVLGMLLATSRPSTCPPVVDLSGDDAEAVNTLGASLLRAGIVAVTSRAPDSECRPVHVHIAGHGPYEVRVRGDAGIRKWRVHLVDLASAMVESSLGAVQAPPPPVDTMGVELAIAVRSDVSVDGTGSVYLGPGVQASICGALPCLDVIGHFGTNIAGDMPAGARHEAVGALGLSIRLGDDDGAFRAGMAVGARFSHVRHDAQFDSQVEWSGQWWPFRDVDQAELLFAWETDLGMHARIGDGWIFDGQLAMQYVPDGDVIGLAGHYVASEVSVRLGFGVRWGMRQ